MKIPKTMGRQRGAALPMMLVLIGAGLAVAAYAIDSARLKSNAAQLKRGTDAAALAVAQEAARDPGARLQLIAEQYVSANLGMDQTLARQRVAVSVEAMSRGDERGYRVRASYRESGALMDLSAPVAVKSAAIARHAPLEVALMLPVDLAVTAAEMPALRTLSRDFMDRLFDHASGDGSYGAGKNVWVSLVPYSQSVSVYDAADPTRVQRWARPRALNPVELTTLFNTGKINSLADQRTPDRRARLLCMYRGLGAGENYHWDQQPVGQFGVYYRHDLPENGSPGATPISWVGPNPMLGQAFGVNDTRSMVADKGCPNAPLLALTDQRQRLVERLDQLAPRFNVNYAIALGWAGMALSPAMRGAGGWGDSRLPLDFDGDGQQPNIKAIVMLAKISGLWMDTDSYNHELNAGPKDNGRAFSRQRFLDLCRSYRQRKIRFHLIGVRAGSDEDNSATDFSNQALPGLTLCSSDRGSLRFVDATDIRAVRGAIAEQLERVADTLKREANHVQLVE